MSSSLETAHPIAMQYPEAFERGYRAGEDHYKLVSAGLRGFYPNDSYPSNPYNKEGDYERWQAFNVGWNSAY